MAESQFLFVRNFAFQLEWIARKTRRLYLIVVALIVAAIQFNATHQVDYPVLWGYATDKLTLYVAFYIAWFLVLLLLISVIRGLMIVVISLLWTGTRLAIEYGFWTVPIIGIFSSLFTLFIAWFSFYNVIGIRDITLQLAITRLSYATVGWLVSYFILKWMVGWFLLTPTDEHGVDWIGHALKKAL